MIYYLEDKANIRWSDRKMDVTFEHIKHKRSDKVRFKEHTKLPTSLKRFIKL
jgi:hypothetical protein